MAILPFAVAPAYSGVAVTVRAFQASDFTLLDTDSVTPAASDGIVQGTATLDLSGGSAGDVYVEARVGADATGDVAWYDTVRIDDAGALVDEYGTLQAGNTYGASLNRKPDITVNVQPTRADGYTTKARVKVLAGGTYLVALSYPNQNDWLYSMTLPVSPDTDTLTVDSNAYGVNRNLAMVEVTIASGAASGAEITLPVDVQPTQGTTDKRLVLFEVIAPTQ